MDFLKKNWAKITVATIALVGAVLMLIPVFVTSEIEFYGLCQSAGLVIFFLGVAANVILKMNDKTKVHAKYVALAVSILVLISMGVGMVGFTPKKDKAHGAFGNAYAYYKSVPTDIEAGQEKIADGEAKVAGLTPLAQGFASAATGLGATSATTTLTQFKALPGTTTEQAQRAAMVDGFVSAGFGAEATTTVAVAAAITGTTLKLAETQLAEGKAQLPADIDATEKDANAAALTILFGYISMMLAFGLIPAVNAIKKIVSKD